MTEVLTHYQPAGNPTKQEKAKLVKWLAGGDAIVIKLNARVYEESIRIATNIPASFITRKLEDFKPAKCFQTTRELKKGQGSAVFHTVQQVLAGRVGAGTISALNQTQKKGMKKSRSSAGQERQRMLQVSIPGENSTPRAETGSPRSTYGMQFASSGNSQNWFNPKPRTGRLYSCLPAASTRNQNLLGESRVIQDDAENRGRLQPEAVCL